MNQLQQPAGHDRRTQARIQVNIPVKVLFPGMSEPMTAINQDISWGGVLFVIDTPPPQKTGPLRIILPWKPGEQITADAHMIRVKPLQDGNYLIAARFFSLSPRSNSRLELLLKMLQGGSQSKAAPNAHSGLVRELEVAVNDNDELRQMLVQIVMGHLEVTVFDTYERNQSIRLAIAGTRGVPGIRLRARVDSVQKTQQKGCDWAELYTLSLKFEHPKASIKAFVDIFLGTLPEAQHDADSSFSEIPDWLRTATFAKPTPAERGRQSGRSGLPCVLETGFPEALNRLTVGWGDIEAFETLFRDLVLGDQGNPGGWPMDAWEELEFLQNVHDRAYGLSNARRNPLKAGRC